MSAPDPQIERLSRLIPTLMGLIHRQVAGDTLAIMHEAGLTLPQMVAMHVLTHRGPQTINAIAEALNLSTSAASHLVDRLVEREYLSRSEDPGDRRQKRVELAPAGVELLDNLTRARMEEFERTASRLDPEVREAVTSLLQQIIEHLQKSL